MIKHDSKDYIMIIDDFVSKEDCDIIIDIFDLFETTGEATTVQMLNNRVDFLNRNDFSMATWDYPGIQNFVLSKVDECFELYRKEFFQVQSVNIEFNEVKLQRTPIRGGFHDWHCEIGEIKTIERCLVWMLYLNDIPEGEGETEFLWQKLRVQPKCGRFVMWPAFFTHVHRGNPVYTHSKYIATGWGIYTDDEFDKYFFKDENGYYHKTLDNYQNTV
jgi:hypothetical protein